MKLYLYNNSSDKKRLVKQLDLVDVLDNIYWKEDTNILHPTFTFHKFKDEQGNWVWKNFNYCALEWAGLPTRYYFVNKFNVNKGGIVEIECEVDVRQTWSAYVLANNYLVARQEHIHNRGMRDDRLAVPMVKTIDSVAFETTVGPDTGAAAGGSIVLTISG